MVDSPLADAALVADEDTPRCRGWRSQLAGGLQPVTRRIASVQAGVRRTEHVERRLPEISRTPHPAKLSQCGPTPTGRHVSTSADCSIVPPKEVTCRLHRDQLIQPQLTVMAPGWPRCPEILGGTAATIQQVAASMKEPKNLIRAIACQNHAARSSRPGGALSLVPG